MRKLVATLLLTLIAMPMLAIGELGDWAEESDKFSIWELFIPVLFVIGLFIFAGIGRKKYIIWQQ